MLAAPHKEPEAAGASKAETEYENTFGTPTKCKFSDMLTKGAQKLKSPQSPNGVAIKAKSPYAPDQ